MQKFPSTGSNFATKTMISELKWAISSTKSQCSALESKKRYTSLNTHTGDLPSITSSNTSRQTQSHVAATKSVENSCKNSEVL